MAFLKKAAPGLDFYVLFKISSSEFQNSYFFKLEN